MSNSKCAHPLCVLIGSEVVTHDRAADELDAISQHYQKVLTEYVKAVIRPVRWNCPA